MIRLMSFPHVLWKGSTYSVSLTSLLKPLIEEVEIKVKRGAIFHLGAMSQIWVLLGYEVPSSTRDIPPTRRHTHALTISPTWPHDWAPVTGTSC